MNEFKVRPSGSECFISDGTNRYLHSDGSIYSCVEFWPFKEIAEEILDKYYPKPAHVWKHGDVMKVGGNPYMFFKLQRSDSIPMIVGLDGVHAVHGLYAIRLTQNAEFLFNINDKLS